MHCHIKDRETTIQKYIDGLLYVEEKDAFDKHCFECESCFQALSLHENIAGLVKAEGDVLFADVHARQNAPGSLSRRSLIDRFSNFISGPGPRLGFALAGICLIFLLVGKYRPDHSVSLAGLADQTACPYVNMELRDSDFSGSTFRIGMRAYQAEDYGTAAGRLLQVIQQDGTDDNARFYLAVSFFMVNRFDEAEFHLQQLVNHEPDRERGFWYLAQICLMRADRESAQRMLSRVAELDQPMFAERAKILLEKTEASTDR